MKHMMSCWLLLASMVVPLGAQQSKPTKNPQKSLLKRLDQDRPGLGRLDDLREQLSDLQGMMDRMLEQLEGRSDLEGSSSGTTIRTGPDGVRVEIRSRESGGEEETKVYEAPDMKTFEEKYPDVAKRYLRGGPLGGSVFRIDPRQLRFDWGDRFDWQGRPFGRLHHVGPRGGTITLGPSRDREPSKGERLGVYIADLAPEVGEFLDLEPGQGLLVQEVTEDSLAQALGIEEGDVVYEMNGTPIFSTQDVRKALRAIDKGEPVKVKVNRKGRDLVLLANKLEAAETAGLRKIESKSKGVIR